MEAREIHPLGCFDEELSRHETAQTRKILLLAVAVYPVFAGLDWVVSPEHGLAFNALRLGVVVALLPLYLALSAGRLASRTPGPAATRLVMAAAPLLVAGSLALMIRFNGGYASPYWFGLCLVSLATGFFYAWPLHLSIPLHLSVHAAYLVPALGDPIEDPALLATTNFYLLATTLIASFTSWTNLQRFRADYRSRSALHEANHRLQEADRLKGEFLANMSHEIRTPMNAIIGSTELLLTTRLDGEQKEYATTSRIAAESLLHLINDILSFSKIEAGRLTIEPVAFAPRELVKEVVVLLAGQAQAKGLELTCDIDPALPECLTGDPIRIRQVLTNLVSNAVKFTAAGTVDVVVRPVASSGRHPLTLFEVRDTGIGICQDKLERIFESFRQADNSTTRRFGGSGLGLAIARRLSQLMGGSLSVESKLGRGTTFRCQLPLEPANAMLRALAHGPDRPRPEPPVDRATSMDRPTSGLRILLVEDHPINQKVATHILKRAGHRVDVAQDGLAAIEKAAGGVHDLILMDVQMPGVDGFEATRRIRALGGPAASTPIIALTAHAMQGYREQCLARGMDGYLPKPVRAADLLRIIERWGKSSHRQRLEAAAPSL